MEKTYEEWMEEVQKNIIRIDVLSMYKWSFDKDGSITICKGKGSFISLGFISLGLCAFFGYMLYITGIRTIDKAIKPFVDNPITIVGLCILALILYWYSKRKVTFSVTRKKEGRKSTNLESITYKKYDKYGSYIILVKTQNGKVLTVLNASGKDEAKKFVKLLKEKIYVSNPEKEEIGQFRN